MATVCLFQNVHVVRYWAVRECQLKINVANCNVSQQLDERDGCVAKPLTIDLLRITLSSIMTAEFRRGRLKIKLRAVLPGLGQRTASNDAICRRQLDFPDTKWRR